MLYGLTGASGVGKTTLGQAVAEDLGITFLKTSITESAKRHGFDAVGTLTLEKRIELQVHLLADMVDLLDKAPRPVITDRTPIDLIGYLLCEFDMHSHLRASDREIALVEKYVETCVDAAAKRFDWITILRPLPTYENAETRPVANRAYQMHCQMVMEGAMNRLYGRMNYTIMASTDLETRKGQLHDRIVARMDELETMRRTSAHIH